MKTAITAALIGLLFIGVVVSESYVVTGKLQPWFFEDKPPVGSIGSRTLLLALLMLAGILAGELHNALAQVRPGGRIKVGAIVASAFRSGSLWRALLASPLVFGAVYMITKDQPDLVISVLLSFENGFFCQAVLRKRTRQFSQKEAQPST